MLKITLITIFTLLFSASMASAEPYGSHASERWQIWAYTSAAPSFIGDHATVIGASGKVIREVTEEEKKAVIENTKHYQDNWKKYSKSIF